MQTCLGKASNRVIDSGIDPRKLGRWVWQRLRGKHNKTAMIITAYRPCPPNQVDVNSTYTQQERYFAAHNDD